jgi:ABC-type multidrug transport system fused ATPase/permease subunit
MTGELRGSIRNMISLLSPSQRRRARALVAGLLVGMVLETFGVGVVIPAITLLTGDAPARWTNSIPGFTWLGTLDASTMAAVGVISVGLLYLLKTVYLTWLASRQMRFIYDVQADLSQRLFTSYLYKPYSFHLQRNSSELLRNVIGATNELTMTGMVSTLILLAECMVLAGIVALLLYVEPAGTLVAGTILGIFGYFLNSATRQAIRRAGEQRQHHEQRRTQYLQQAIGGAKELKLLGRERGALALYEPHNRASASIGQFQATLQAIPKLWLELFGVAALVILVLVMVAQGKAVSSLVPTIGVFAAAAFRLIPCVNRILGSVQYIRQSRPIIDVLTHELRDALPAPSARYPVETQSRLHRSIRVESVSVSYPGGQSPVIQDASFEVPAGTTVGIIGGSGSGKSTLVDAMLGLLPLDSGKILCDGSDIETDVAAWQRRIGYVPQSIYLTDDSIRRNIAFGLEEDAIDPESMARAVSAAQLDAFVGSLPAGLETMVGEHGVRLSGGQRQRIGIARALYHNPAVLVLDEATSALDEATESEVMAAINLLHGEKTILIVTHRLKTLRYCDQVFLVANGSVSPHQP